MMIVPSPLDYKKIVAFGNMNLKRVQSSCVLPGLEYYALPVIIVAFRKWAPVPLPAPGGIR